MTSPVITLLLRVQPDASSHTVRRVFGLTASPLVAVIVIAIVGLVLYYYMTGKHHQ